MKLYEYLKDKREEINEDSFLQKTYLSPEGQEALGMFGSYMKDLFGKIKNVDSKDIRDSLQLSLQSIKKKISSKIKGQYISSDRKEKSGRKISKTLNVRKEKLQELSGSGDQQREGQIAQKTNEIVNAMKKIESEIEKIQNKDQLVKFLKEYKNIGQHNIAPAALPKPEGGTKKQKKK